MFAGMVCIFDFPLFLCPVAVGVVFHLHSNLLKHLVEEKLEWDAFRFSSFHLPPEPWNLCITCTATCLSMYLKYLGIQFCGSASQWKLRFKCLSVG